MDQQYRLLLAFALSIGLWLAYNELVLKPYAPPPLSPEETAAGGSSVSNTTIPAPPPEAASAPEAQAASFTGAPTVVIDTDVTRVTLTTRGGRLLGVELKAYRETVDPSSPPLNLVRTGDVLPLTVRLTDGQSDAAVDYAADVATVEVRGGDRREVSLRGKLADGRSIEKRFIFQGDHYEFEVAAKVDGASAVSLNLTAIPSQDPKGMGSEVAVALVGKKYTHHALGGLTKEQPVTEAQATWSGFATHYFLSAMAPVSRPSDALFGLVGDVPVAHQEALADQGAAIFAVYTGPKEEGSLDRAGHELGRALDFGYFWFAAIPLLHALRLLKSLIGNYGVAIILLTTAVKVVTIPLTRSTFRNMREMQKIQPQMTKLRERFKDDPAALQKEMMELYRRHRVNPFSGCLPMLLQLPIFIGLYNALSSAIELRHAPFALWITDLSAPDRLTVAGFGIPVLTLLMGGSMLLQQWMSPQQGDPTQQRIMMLMPLVFTFMFINLPSGLVLYWLINNLLTIGQQYSMLRSST